MSSNGVEDSVADTVGKDAGSVSGSVDDLDGEVILAVDVLSLSVSYVGNVDDGRSCWSQNGPL